jgi:hypothetical protein
LEVGRLLSFYEKRVLKVSLVVFLFFGGVVLTSAFLVQSIPLVLLISALMSIGLYWFYIRYVRKKKPQHPFGPPDGKPDIYFPRSDIPRPLYEDMRKMKEEERKAQIEARKKK